MFLGWYLQQRYSAARVIIRFGRFEDLGVDVIVQRHLVLLLHYDDF